MRIGGFQSHEGYPQNRCFTLFHGKSQSRMDDWGVLPWPWTPTIAKGWLSPNVLIPVEIVPGDVFRLGHHALKMGDLMEMSWTGIYRMIHQQCDVAGKSPCHSMGRWSFYHILPTFQWPQIWYGCLDVPLLTSMFGFKQSGTCFWMVSPILRLKVLWTFLSQVDSKYIRAMVKARLLIFHMGDGHPSIRMEIDTHIHWNGSQMVGWHPTPSVHICEVCRWSCISGNHMWQLNIRAIERWFFINLHLLWFSRPRSITRGYQE